MGTDKIFCYNCCHSDNINFCKFRKIFVRLQKGRYCQDFVDKTKVFKKEEELIPQLVKSLEEVPVPTKTKLELKPIEIKKVSLIRRILNWIIRRFKWLTKKK